MKQVFNVRGKAQLRDVPIPQCGPHEILVRNWYSAISVGTELKSLAPKKITFLKKALQRKDLIGMALKKVRQEGVLKTYKYARSMVSGGWPLGYSCAGSVIAVGESVATFKVGDTVACAGLGYASHAEYVHVPMTMAAKIPDGADIRQASFATIGAVAIHALHRAEISFGQIVVVYGMGLIGSITARILHAASCQVIGIDIDGERLKKTALHKAVTNDPVEEVLAFTAQRGADVVVITATDSGSEIINNAMKMCRRGGKVVIVGRVGLELDRQPFYDNEISLLISRSYGPGRHDEQYEEKGIDLPIEYVRWTIQRNMEEFLRLLREKKIRLDDLIEAEYSLEEAPKAYGQLHGGGRRPMAVIIRYPPEAKSVDREL